LLPARDEDRAPQVMQQLLADGAEQEAGEVTVAGADNDELGGLGDAGEDVTGVSRNPQPTEHWPLSVPPPRSAWTSWRNTRA
jgi:hypothetical protein